MSTREFQPLVSKRTLARLVSKIFSAQNSLQIQIINFMIFAHFVVGLQIVIMSGWIETLYTVQQNLHYDSNSWVSSKTKTFQELSQPIESHSYCFANLMQTFIFFVQIAIDFSQPFISDSNFYILSPIYYSSQPSRTVWPRSASDSALLVPSLIFPCPFSVSVSASSKLYRVFFNQLFPLLFRKPV